MKKNCNRRDFHGHHGSKRRVTGATRTLTWVAHIHSQTYINTVTTTGGGRVACCHGSARTRGGAGRGEEEEEGGGGQSHRHLINI